MESETTCTGCGAERALWQEPRGVAHARGTFCCGACASSPASCDCAKLAPTKDEIRDDPASAHLMQSLLHQTDTMTTADYDRGLVKKPAPGDIGHA